MIQDLPAQPCSDEFDGFSSAKLRGSGATMAATAYTSVYALISRVLLTDTGATDPRQLAESVAEQIPEDRRMQVLIDMLVPQVKSMMRIQRNEAMSRAMSLRNTQMLDHDPRSASAPAASFRLEQSAPRLKPRSAKVEGIRDWWATMLASRVHVGDSRWIALGDCGATELLFAENERRTHAEREVNRAHMYMRLRELLARYEVDTVAELPTDTARETVA
ncbi:hypothetical protein [Nocardia suismassiliense]|uniref:hypothetical protein n=1 Tax=Nocardia suismassiliense TaxID=2077092 RepID=UPI00131F0DD8|nr:hypothetical protein [Nocardia suismassiliense]